ncbi:hypothetical protein [Kutzneria buriramensis]|uniref:Uncharacterized protein n=1 Tax=Kutzneria buriramensis TaxID=1045776 RepID=A0A3E0G506_9PSEU|nr:hypothetical protein [Kutzneria buriramensis]REH17894.1 hypothetical protein BCF44_14111 [Kutzneria buriramensis]
MHFSLTRKRTMVCATALAAVGMAGFGLAPVPSAEAATVAPVTGTWELNLRVLHTNNLTRSVRIGFTGEESREVFICTNIAAGQTQVWNITGQLSSSASVLSFESPDCATGTVQPIGLLDFVTPNASLKTFYITIGSDRYR